MNSLSVPRIPDDFIIFLAIGITILRNQCEAASIKADDEERLAVEATVSRATEAYKLGNVEKSLDELSKADSLIEKLRRRI